MSDQKKIIRILGHGQFVIDNDTMQEVNIIDNVIVKLLENEQNDDLIKDEFEKQIKRLNAIVKEKGNIIGSTEIVQSDVVIPDKDITIDQARRLFKGEGIIKDIY